MFDPMTASGPSCVLCKTEMEIVEAKRKHWKCPSCSWVSPYAMGVERLERLERQRSAIKKRAAADGSVLLDLLD